MTLHIETNSKREQKKFRLRFQQKYKYDDDKPPRVPKYKHVERRKVTRQSQMTDTLEEYSDV